MENVDMPDDKKEKLSNQEDSGDNPWVNGRKKSVKEGHAENTSNEDSSDSIAGITHVKYEMEMGEDDDSDEFEMGGFIGIRSQEDDIFEHYDEDEFDDDDFPIIPQVELRTPSARKRKQVINLRDNGDNEINEIGDDTEHDNMSYGQQSFTIDPELYATRRRDPLYLLNPDDYAHDITKRVRIKRAIISNRRHQAIKEQIIKLTDENQKLRAHREALRAKLEECLDNCVCTKPKIKNASLNELNIKIPVVPPRVLFASNANLASVALRPVKVEPGLSLTASFSNKVPGSASILGSLSSRIVQNNSGQVLKTASGQVLGLAQTPKVPASPAFTTTEPAYKRPISHYHQSILPKPVEETAPAKKVSLPDMYKKYDEDDDEDLVAISPIPPKRKRKQELEIRKFF